MRFPPMPLLAAFACGIALAPAHAQEQERKLMDRIERPDMTRSFGADKKDFMGSKSFSGGGAAQVKDYSLLKNFRSKDYLTGSYSGNKGFWMGDFKYATQEADTEGRGAAAQARKKDFATKALPVKDLQDGGKTYASRTMATKAVEWKGRSQDKMDVQGPEAMNTIRDGTFTELKTIDDVRNLLNKN